MDKQKQLEDLITNIATLREAEEEIYAKLSGVQVEFQGIIESLDVTKRRDVIAADWEHTVATEKELIVMAKALALEISQESGFENRNPVGGIEIKHFDTTIITDERKAMVWAAKYMPSALTLNEGKFASAVAKLDLPFIEKGEEYRAQIASKLESEQ